MKLIVIALALALTACGPHFLGKPEPYHPEPSEKAAPPLKPDTVTVNLPNWPGWVYTTPTTDAFVILVVQNPEKFPVPAEMTFTADKMEPVVMKLVPKPVEEPKK
jgi:hypothetical protein